MTPGLVGNGVPSCNQGYQALSSYQGYYAATCCDELLEKSIELLATKILLHLVIPILSHTVNILYEIEIIIGLTVTPSIKRAMF